MSDLFNHHLVDEERARRLLASQFPALLGLPMIATESTGTDNQIFRLGEKLCLRFPKAVWAAETAKRETNILPRFKDLPLDVPSVFGLGLPGEDYPWHWSVMSWLPGEAIGTNDFDDMAKAAEQLAEFLLAMRRVPVDLTFAAGEHNSYRGVPLSERDTLFRDAARHLSDLFSGEDMLRVWELCSGAPHAADPSWLHGDIHGGNMLKQDGHLTAIIDWGLSGIGDAACDLSAGWAVFNTPERAVFFDALEASEPERLRGAGWALSIAAIFLAHNRHIESLTEMPMRTIRWVLEDFS